MTIRSQRRFLWMITISLGMGSVFILSFALTSPIDHISSENSTPNSAPTPSEGSANPITTISSESALRALPPQESFIQLAARNYRQRLFDLPPPAPTPPAEPKPLPAFRLVGTVLNPSQPRAMIEDKRGQVIFKSIGDRIGDESNYAVIASIESESITLKHEGRTVTVKKE